MPTAYKYEQATGILRNGSGAILAKGFAGAPGHINLTASESLHDLGPIPRGGYTITLIYPTHSTFGPLTCVLTPDRRNTMFGRAGFLMHGDKIGKPGTGSTGCIIMPYPTRNAMRVGDRINVV